MSNRSPSDVEDDVQDADESPSHVQRGEDRAIYRWSDGIEPSVGIVEAVADETGHDPTSLPTLQDAVDVDAMNRLLASTPADGPVTITFEYAGLLIEADNAGWIAVES